MVHVCLSDPIFVSMTTNTPRLDQFGDQLDKLLPGKTFRREFRVFKRLFGKSDDAAAEEEGWAFAKQHHCTFWHDVEQGLGIFTRADRS